MKEIFIALSVFVLAGVGVWFGYRYYKDQRALSDARPSIERFSSENLPKDKKVPVVDSNNEKNSEVPKVPGKPDDPKMIAIKVLNGGAAGGSAGKMVAFLKSNGYEKAEAGNANGSNSGIVVYFAPEMSDEVKPLQIVLLKSYRGVTAKPVADAKIPEAKMAPIVVVVGK